MLNIASKDISVIVRGLVVDKFTKRSLDSIRKSLPKAQIILSTWQNSDVSNLGYDELVLTPEPEESVFMLRDDGSKKLIASNNQIITTRNALARARGKYVISMRSDLVLKHDKFLKYFAKYNENTPKEILEKRIVVLPTYNPKFSPPYLFNVCDWFYFGTKEDITKIFSIPLMQQDNLVKRESDKLAYIKDNLESEQYIWTSFLKENGFPANLPSVNHYTEELKNLSEKSLANYTIMLPASMAGLVCLKMPHAGYGARPWLSQGLYTWNEYKKLYNKYNDDSATIIPNPIESIMYFFAFYTRKLIKEKFPAFYNLVVNQIRKFHGSSNLLK